MVESEAAEIDIDAWRAKLDELEAKLSRYPHVIDALAPPATEAELQKYQSIGPYSLPEWVKEIYRWHNGADRSIGMLFGYPLLSLNQAIHHYGDFESAGGEFGWFRPFFYPIAGVDKDFLLITLDSDEGETEQSLMWWFLQDFPSVSFLTPFDWIDSLLWKLDYVDEDSFDDDGSFSYYDSTKWPQRFAPTAASGPGPQYDGTDYRNWTPAWRERAGVDKYLIYDSELPPPQERERKRRSRRQPRTPDAPPPHPGPWDIEFEHMSQIPGSTKEVFGLTVTTNRKPEPPWLVRRRFLLPEGVLSERILSAGTYLKAVVWLDPETLEDEHPVITKVRFPMPDEPV